MQLDKHKSIHFNHTWAGSARPVAGAAGPRPAGRPDNSARAAAAVMVVAGDARSSDSAITIVLKPQLSKVNSRLNLRLGVQSLRLVRARAAGAGKGLGPAGSRGGLAGSPGRLAEFRGLGTCDLNFAGITSK